MLALTRKEGEAVHLDLPNGDRVTVHVLIVRGNETRLAFDAPRDVEIWREEIAPPRLDTTRPKV